ncbi:ABC-three component system protein [Sphingopyxis sp. R3-92]|uniref:ABC-three component system protein n=1 Tax=Sphingopyxis sp. R3-92 TaxID=3158553 RepID=UPI003EE703A2
MATAKRSATAAPAFSGYIFQLERALFHLATAGEGAVVAVEHPDDVAVFRGGKPTLVEQDKNSVQAGRDILRNRSKDLWRTLQLWLALHEGPDGPSCVRYLLVTNTVSSDSIVSALKQYQAKEIDAAVAVAKLRSDSGPKSNSKIQKIIDDVLARSDDMLATLLAKVEIIESSSLGESRGMLATALAIDPGVDADMVVDNLLGWVTRLLRDRWQAREIGMIERSACVRQCRRTEQSLIRQRLLPRPSREVMLEDTDRERVKARPFVAHLGRIKSEDDVVFEAIDHFLQFNIEKHRLTTQGEIPDREWADRSDRLAARWRGVVRRVKLDLPEADDMARGQHILARSTTDHHEPLGGHACDELYMTAGHYHRLADEDLVWWDPAFKKDK